MFHCSYCEKISQPGEPCKKLYFFQKVTYKARVTGKVQNKVHRFKNEGVIEFRDDPGGKGYNIIGEKDLCQRCFVQLSTFSDGRFIVGDNFIGIFVFRFESFNKVVKSSEKFFKDLTRIINFDSLLMRWKK